MSSVMVLLYALFVVVGVLAGWVASGMPKSGAIDRRTSMIVGAVGALIGGWLFSKLPIETTGWFWSLMAALACAIIALGITRAIVHVIHVTGKS